MKITIQITVEQQGKNYFPETVAARSATVEQQCTLEEAINLLDDNAREVLSETKHVLRCLVEQKDDAELAEQERLRQEDDERNPANAATMHIS